MSCGHSERVLVCDEELCPDCYAEAMVGESVPERAKHPGYGQFTREWDDTAHRWIPKKRALQLTEHEVTLP